MAGLAEIPARRGKAVRLRQGERLRLVNTHGQQVVDTWAFAQADIGEFLSMEHSRTHLAKLFPTTGDTLLSNRRRPILSFVEDISGGIHDTLIAACDRRRYELLGVPGHHDNCADNLVAALAELGLMPPEIPAPLNLFMNIPVEAGGALAFEPSLAAPGSYVTLHAEMDLVAVFSCCPQDIVPINGVARQPREVHYEILAAG